MARAPQALTAYSPVVGQEEDLVPGLKARSADAWSELYDANYERLRKYAIARVGSHEEAEDIASLTFLRALQKIDSYKSNGRPILAWLYGITQNVILEKRRAKAREQKQSVIADEQTADSMLPSAEDLDVAQLLDLQAALSVLTPRQREVITLLHLGGFDVREVAAMLGKGVRSVYYLEARALIRLRDELIAQEERA